VDNCNGNILVFPDDNSHNEDTWGDENANADNNRNYNNNDAPNPNPTIVEDVKEDDGSFKCQGIGDDNSRLLQVRRRLFGFMNPEVTVYVICESVFAEVKSELNELISDNERNLATNIDDNSCHANGIATKSSCSD
jgi:hypothetical protein